MRAMHLAAAIAVVFLSAVPGTPTRADPIPPGSVGQNIEAVGYSNLNDKPGFKMSIQKVGERWYLYLGMLWNEGWQIVDVTDPANPKVVKEIQGPDNTATDQMEIADGKMITALAKISPGWGGDPAKPFDEGVLIWDLKDPLNPQKLGQYKTGSLGTHRNGYQGGKYMHLSAIMPGYKGNIYVIVDISDPAHPVEAGRWWVPGQKDGETPAAPPGTMLHGPAFIVGNTAYLPYGGAGMIILDITDVAHPKQDRSAADVAAVRLQHRRAYGDSGAGTKDRLHQFRSDPGGLQGAAAECLDRRHFGSRQAAADGAVSAAAAAGGLADQKLLRARRPFRAAQPEHAAAQSVRAAAGQSGLSHLLQRGFTDLRRQHGRPRRARSDTSCRPIRRIVTARSRRENWLRKPRTCWSIPGASSTSPTKTRGSGS